MKGHEKVAYLGSILKRVGNFNMDSFENRLIFQKTVYLIEVFVGVNLDCGKFSWYKRGPYSPDLTKIGYDLKDSYRDLIPSRFVDEKVESRFKEFLQFIGEKKDDQQYLELLASMHWLKHQNPDLEDDTISQYLMETKPQIDLSLYDEAWASLRKYGLVDGGRT
ncbi:hypothetical protein V7O62_08720 [Methanolobus sp. ZRKC2]|uniref:hypothetical protein n=1 Tax=Methanolobus sp. ZRKC2 TaxID=3125783 RepID=UPI00324DF59E